MAEIRVFVMFPLDTLSSDWKWVHCLTFPVDTVDKLQLTSRPYKWIRYATGAVVGAQGDLAFSSVLPHNAMDYGLDLPSKSTDLFYHISDAEKQRMFPVDPDMDRTYFNASSDVSSWRMDFLDVVAERDGTCVLTGFAERSCEAVHLLSHSKGNEYIQTYTRRRSRDPDGNDIVDDVDDVRNGILLNRIAPTHFGTDTAFLVTPNFAMTTADVDPAASPTVKRCTAHVFVPGPGNQEYFGILGGPAHPSCERTVRMPETTDDWPPDTLFDAVYARAVVHHFAADALRDALRRYTSTLCPAEIQNAPARPANMNARAAQIERRKHDEAREQRAIQRRNDRLQYRNRGDIFDMLLYLPYILMPPDEVEAHFRAMEERRAALERSRVVDKVKGWAEGVADAHM